ncbi:phosphotransferase family protein [Myxococcota bacterium]|nr:phosphotransferase family protein [Myxococcota bacterium]
MTTLAEMALAHALRDRLPALLGGAVTLNALAPLHGGSGQENFRLDVAIDDGPLAGRRTFALRGDALQPTPNVVSRALEAAVIEAALAAGVRTPRLHGLLPDLFGVGLDAYLADFVAGIALGPRIVRDPAFAPARARLPLQLAEALATLHALTPATHPALPIDRAPFERHLDPVAAALQWFERTLDALDAPRPAAEYALRWLRHHPPASREITLVHGDFRTGNFLVTEQGLSAILDWENAHWGNPLEDLAWLTLRDWRFGQLDLPVGGFGALEPFLAAYVDLSGRPIRPADLHWWAVAGNLRSALSAVHNGRGTLEIERMATPRRAPEMEFEALRLIEVGP